ncbi:MAG TPA: thiamine phosphate synthase [Planctomycetota bacterium]|nr:thiamine phosphate synthase [Planctomycetota bacterium]
MSALAPRLDPSLLRLVLVTDGRGELERIEAVTAAAIEGGVRCVQLREAKWSARQIMLACERLMPMLERVGGILLVNDRLDLAVARMAHGAQIGYRSLPPEVAREVLGTNSLLGYSAHDQGELDLAVAGDCDFALLSPVWPTTSKPGMPHLGEARAAHLTTKARLPVVWLGGIDAVNAARIPLLAGLGRPVGIAVRSALMTADDPRAAAAALLRAFAGDPAGVATRPVETEPEHG